MPEKKKKKVCLSSHKFDTNQKQATFHPKPFHSNALMDSTNWKWHAAFLYWTKFEILISVCPHLRMRAYSQGYCGSSRICLAMMWAVNRENNHPDLPCHDWRSESHNEMESKPENESENWRLWSPDLILHTVRIILAIVNYMCLTRLCQWFWYWGF